MSIAGYLWYKKASGAGTSICAFNDKFDCDSVNASPYATVDGISYLLTFHWGLPIPFVALPIPVAALGTFLLLGILVTVIVSRWTSYGNDANLLTHIRRVLLIGCVFTFYLIGIQAWVIGTWCVYCLALDAFIYAATVVSHYVLMPSKEDLAIVESTMATTTPHIIATIPATPANENEEKIETIDKKKEQF